MEYVTLVDSNDNEIGSEEKLSAHTQGLLHRAFSILLFDTNQRIILQKRAITKYHSGGLWTNACCGHPRPGESTLAAATRRLGEELNIETPLKHLFSFQYQCSFENGLIEHEFDHVFVGTYPSSINPNPLEVAEIKQIGMHELVADIKANPLSYTEWFKLLIPYYFKHQQA